MSIERKFSSGVAWMAAGNWIEQVINFSVFVLLARFLGAEAFGLLAMAAAFVLLCEFLVRESFSDFLISHEDPSAEHFNAVFWMLAVFGGGLFIVLWALAGPISSIYGEDEVVGLVRALAPTVLMIALTAVPVAILRRELRFATLSLRAIAGVTVGGIVALVMVLYGYGFWALAGQRLAQVFTNIIMAWAAVSWRPRLKFSREHLREVGRFGGAVLGLRAAELASTQLPSVIIGAALGAGPLGYFAVAWRLVEIGSFLIVTPLRMVSQPAFAALARSGEGATKLLRNISRVSGMVAFSLFAGLAVLADPVIGILFKGSWEPAAPTLAILSVFGAYLCIEKIHQAFCLAAGRARATTLVAWAEVAVASTAVWFLAPYGIEHAALGLVGTFLLFWPLRFVIVARIGKARARDFIALHALPFIGAVAMAILITLVLGQLDLDRRWQKLAVGVGTGAVFIGIFSWVFMRDRIMLLTKFAAMQTSLK